MALLEVPCSFIKFSEDLPSYVGRDQVRTLSPLETQTIFHESFKSVQAQAPASREVLARLHTLSPATASILECKTDRLEEFVFRLILPRSQQTFEPSSFLALSYCWRTELGLHSRDPSTYSLPIPPLLFAALTRELKSDSEGIWCDQICIDQENNDEKAVSIGMMDIVYREARRTVIALADIQISKEEQSVLESYLQNYPTENLTDPHVDTPHRLQMPPYIQSQPVLYNFYWKILGSRWFQRAWCAHEMRLGRQQIFLVACEDQRTVLRMTVRFFAHLMILASEMPRDLQSGRSVGALQRGSANQTVWNGIFGGPRFGNYLRTFSDINQLVCGGDPNPKFSPDQRAQSAIRDKMVINLNSNNLGLTLTKAASDIAACDTVETIFTDDNSFKTLAILSLASRDPTILCTTGEPISCGSSQRPTHSWIRRFIQGDTYAVRDHRVLAMEEMRLSIDENDAFIELEMRDFSGSDIKGPLQRMIQQSGMLIIGFRESSRPQSNLYYDWKDFMSTNEETRRIFIYVLACILQCGIPWILQTLSFSEKSFVFREFATASLRPLLDRLPPWLQTTPVDHLHEEEMEASEAESIAWIQTDEGWKAADSVLQFAMCIILKSLPKPWRAEIVKSFLPFILSRSNNRKHVIFWHRQYNEPVITVPRILTEDKFEDLNRVWFLDMVRSEGNVQYHLAGRQRIFGPSIADMAHQGCTELLRVYGPRV